MDYCDYNIYYCDGYDSEEDYHVKGKPYPFYASIGYMTFDNRKHKNIDDLIKDCDRKMIKSRKAELM